MLLIYCGNRTIHDPRTSTYNVWNISLHRALNASGTLDFTIYDDHPNSRYVYPNCEEIRVSRYDIDSDTESIIFYGRVLTTSITLHGERDILCEGELGYLMDTIVQPYSKYTSDTESVIEDLLRMHNNQVVPISDIDKRIYLDPNPGAPGSESSNWNSPYMVEHDVDGDGQITSADSRIAYNACFSDGVLGMGTIMANDTAAIGRRYSIYASAILNWSIGNTAFDYLKHHLWTSQGGEKILDFILQNFVNIHGGNLFIHHKNGNRYLTYQNINTQPNVGDKSRVSIGENIIDIQVDRSSEDRITHIIPFGAEITKTEELSVNALNGKTWLAFGDGSSVCHISNTVINDAFSDEQLNNISDGTVSYYKDQSYTGSYTSGQLNQNNKYTSNGKSYIELLTAASGMKTISMAQDSETLYKHGCHLDFSGGSGVWSQRVFDENDNTDKSVFERLYDMFGPAEIISEKPHETYAGDRVVETEEAFGMILKYDKDHPNEPLSGIRTCDFVTLFLGTNDWLNADSILGNNDLGTKYSRFRDVANTQDPSVLRQRVSTRPIEDYISYSDKTDEDGNKSGFKITMYWELRMLCMYLKACFPASNIIIFSPFGKKISITDGGTSETNKVGNKQWYRDPNASLPWYRRYSFYSKTVTDPFMMPNQNENPNGEWNRDDTASPAYNVIEYNNHKYVKVHVNGSYDRKQKTAYEITQYGRAPGVAGAGNVFGDNGAEHTRFFARGKVSEKQTVIQDGNSTEVSREYLKYISKWNSLDGHNVSYIASTNPITISTNDYENSPDIFKNPYEYLEENSYSIDYLKTAISTVVQEFGITFVDSENATNISVNNYADISEDTDPETTNTYISTALNYDNIGSMGTKKGLFGESFYDGEHLNDLGQLKMACAVRNAMIEALISNGLIDAPERLHLTGNEPDYYNLIEMDPGTDRATDRPWWHIIRMVPSSMILKTEGIYTTTGRKIHRKYTDKDPDHTVQQSGGTLYRHADAGGYSALDLTNVYGDLQNRAFNDMDFIFSGNDANLKKNIELTNELVPTTPGDPIVCSVVFDDITNKEDLLYAAGDYLMYNQRKIGTTISIKAIDMNILDPTKKRLDVGDGVIVNALRYGIIDKVFIVSSITETDNPKDTVITLKTSSALSSGREQKSSNSAYSSIDRMSDILQLFGGTFGNILSNLSSIGKG